MDQNPAQMYRDRIEFALRDAGFDYDDAFRIAALASGMKLKYSYQGLVSRLYDSAQLSTLPEWCRDMMRDAGDQIVQLENTIRIMENE